MTTELCRRLRRRTDKPHIYIGATNLLSGLEVFHVWMQSGYVLMSAPHKNMAKQFCIRVCQNWRLTPGAAALAWHNYKSR